MKLSKTASLIKSSFRSLEDFSFEEIKSDTELLRRLQWPTEPTVEPTEPCFDKDKQRIDCITGELYVEPEETLGKAEARFYQDCEFSMESPGMIFMYGATLVLVVLAIIAIYVAKRKT